MPLPRTGPSRRQLLSLGLVAGTTAAGIVLVPDPGAAATTAAGAGDAATVPATRRWTSRTSQNGWPVIPSAAVHRTKVEGSDAHVSLRTGSAAIVLLHVLRRYHYEVESLEREEVIGYRTDRTVGAPFESNHLSGTAVTVHPGLHPLGATGTLFPLQVAIVRDILADCDGLVRWGGDDPAHPAEGFFQLDAGPGDAAITRLATRITGWHRHPGEGAGAAVDPFDSTRRARADRLAGLQHRR